MKLFVFICVLTLSSISQAATLLKVKSEQDFVDTFEYYMHDINDQVDILYALRNSKTKKNKFLFESKSCELYQTTESFLSFMKTNSKYSYLVYKDAANFVTAVRKANPKLKGTCYGK